MTEMQSYPPWLWGPPATGAVAGAPGVYVPADAKRPADLADLADVVADPVTAWAPGEYVPTRAGDAWWDGAAWEAGRAPAPVGAAQAPAGAEEQGNLRAGAGTSDQLTPPQLVAGPAGYTPPLPAGERPRNLQELAERAQPEPREPWAAGEWVAIGRSGKRAHWTGTEWRGGDSPGYAPAGDDVSQAAAGDTSGAGGDDVSQQVLHDASSAPGEEPSSPARATPPPPYRATGTQFPGDEQPGDLTR